MYVHGNWALPALHFDPALRVIGIFLNLGYFLDFEFSCGTLFDNGDCYDQKSTLSSTSSSQIVVVSPQEGRCDSFQSSTFAYLPPPSSSSLQRFRSAWCHRCSNDGQCTMAMPGMQTVEEALSHSLSHLSIAVATSNGQNVCAPGRRTEADDLCSSVAFSATAMESSAVSSRVESTEVKEPYAYPERTKIQKCPIPSTSGRGQRTTSSVVQQGERQRQGSDASSTTSTNALARLWDARSTGTTMS